MERKVSLAVRDLVETIERVQGKIQGKTFADFESDWELKFIIQRAIEIISGSKSPNPRRTEGNQAGNRVA
jgi:uncharacterized protein with HEPN domain